MVDAENTINIRKVLVVNGPNLGRLGVRQPDVYGSQDFKTLCALCKKWAQELNLQVEVRQSDDEAQWFIGCTKLLILIRQ